MENIFSFAHLLTGMLHSQSLIELIAKTLANGIHTPLTRVLILISIRLFSANFYAFICFAKFPVFVFRSYIPGTMYFTGFAVIFDCSKPAAFQPYPPNFILGENSFCFLKFPISDFSNLGDSHFPFGGYWGNKILPPIFLTFNISLPITSL